MNRPAIFLVIALALVGIAFATLPFGRPGIRPEQWRPMNSDECSAPVVSAFRTEHLGGWFGYAPLTDVPPNQSLKFPTCRAPAQRRLTYAGMFLLAAAVIVIALRRERGEAVLA